MKPAHVAIVGAGIMAGGFLMYKSAKSSGPYLKTAIALIKQEEGFSATAYRDANGYSIAYGHFIKPNEQHLMQAKLSKADGEQLLLKDVAWAVDAVNAGVKVNITENQRAALVSFCYNVGAGGFQKSTLLKQINAGNTKAAAAQFDDWIYAQGKVNNALVSRRGREKTLFLG